MTTSLIETAWIRSRLTIGSAAIALSAIMLLAAPSALQAQQQGGEVVNAIASGPNSLDPHISANSAEIQINNHIYEGLVAMDEDFNPAPALARSIDVSEDSTVFTFTLREGVLFHNGEEMTSADVLASFERYRELSTNAAALEDVSSFAAPDDYTFVITLNNPNAVFLEILKTPRQMFAIVPASEAEKPVNEMEVIGTGPFRFVEWSRDSHILLERFEDYVPNPAYEGADGFAGNRTVYVDSARFAFVPEPQTMVAGLQTGDFHNSRGFPSELASRFDGDDSVTIQAYSPVFQMLFPVNAGHGPTADPLIRQAIRAVVSVDDIMTVATGGNYVRNHSML